MFLRVFFPNFVTIPKWKDIFRMSICCYSVMKSGQFHCKRIVERVAHVFVSYIYLLYIPHEAWAIVYYFCKGSPEPHNGSIQ